MFDNSGPVTLTGYLGDTPEAKVDKNGNTYAQMSIGVSHYVGKNANGESQYETEWVEARAFDGRYDKLANLILTSGQYHKGTPVIVIARRGVRKDESLMYRDSSGNPQTPKNPMIRNNWTIEEIGVWAKEKRGHQNQQQAQPQQQNQQQQNQQQFQQPQQNQQAPSAADAF